MKGQDEIKKALSLCPGDSLECEQDGCPYWDVRLCVPELHIDALELLKEQETHKFFVDESGKITPLPVVVRCKDCKHGRQYDTNAIDCEYRELATEPDWFCADGERKSD